jgi:hypothetical protein
VRAAKLNRIDGNSAAEKKKSGALWSVKFVGREAGGVANVRDRTERFFSIA